MRPEPTAHEEQQHTDHLEAEALSLDAGGLLRACPADTSGRHWRFHVRDDGHESIYLMITPAGGRSRLVAMAMTEKGLWQRCVRLAPGQYRVRYYRMDLRGSLTYAGPVPSPEGDWGLPVRVPYPTLPDRPMPAADRAVSPCPPKPC